MSVAFFGRPGVGGIVWIIVVGTISIVCGETEDKIISSPSGGGSGKGLSHGLGDHIDWHTLEEGQELSEKEGKPLMLIIHKSWCGACKSLKPKFKESQEIASLSKKFVMVNTEDDEEPKGEKFKPDGGYIPRILFLDSSGNLMDITNEGGNPSYKYYYFDADSVADSMRKAISTLGDDGTEGESEDGQSNNIESEESDDATISGDNELNKDDTYSTAKIEL